MKYMKKKSIDIEQFIKDYQIKNAPVMLYDLKQLRVNVDRILEFKFKYNIEFVFPVKSFPNHKILQFFYDCGFVFDVANENEFAMIKDIIKEDTLISCNGVDVISKKKNYNNIIYNLNSISSLNNNGFYNGVRINSYKNRKTDFSKFWIDINKINLVPNKEDVISISFHFYDENKLKNLKYIFNDTKKCLDRFENLKYINFGGNWDVLNYNYFEKQLVEIRKNIDSNFKIIFEVGENWFDNCGYLIAKVIGENEIANKKKFYINAVKDSVAKWFVLRPINLKYEDNNNYITIISGCSCYEKDVFSVLNKSVSLSMNEKVVFLGLNGYSYAWCKEFNGSLAPEVIFYD